MKKAVFLIHGFLTGKDDFKPIYNLLSESYDDVHLFNLPGHINQKLNEFTVKDTLNQLLLEFDELQRENPTIDVIGYSLGGALATYLSNERQFNKLVLLSPANKFINYKVPLFKGKYYLKQLKGYFLNHNVNKEVIKNSFQDELQTLKMTALNVLNKDITKALNTFLLLTDYTNNHMKRIENPILIIWGELDEIVPIDSIRYVFSKCKNENRSIHIIQNVGHIMLYSKHNRIIVDLIKEFLEI